MFDITYDEEHIKGIVEVYNECVALLEDIMVDITEAESEILAAYDGKANDGLVEYYKVLFEHITLLNQCFEATSSYIDNTLEAMIQYDNQSFNPWYGWSFGGNDE